MRPAAIVLVGLAVAAGFAWRRFGGRTAPGAGQDPPPPADSANAVQAVDAESVESNTESGDGAGPGARILVAPQPELPELERGNAEIGLGQATPGHAKGVSLRERLGWERNSGAAAKAALPLAMSAVAAILHREGPGLPLSPGETWHSGIYDGPDSVCLLRTDSEVGTCAYQATRQRFPTLLMLRDRVQAGAPASALPLTAEEWTALEELVHLAEGDSEVGTSPSPPSTH